MLVDSDGVIYESAIIDEYLKKHIRRFRSCHATLCNGRERASGSITAIRAYSKPADISLTIMRWRSRKKRCALSHDIQIKKCARENISRATILLRILPTSRSSAAYSATKRRSQRSAARERLDATSAPPPGRASDAVRKCSWPACC